MLDRTLHSPIVHCRVEPAIEEETEAKPLHIKGIHTSYHLHLSLLTPPLTPQPMNIASGQRVHTPIVQISQKSSTPAEPCELNMDGSFSDELLSAISLFAPCSTWMRRVRTSTVTNPKKESASNTTHTMKAVL